MTRMAAAALLVAASCAPIQGARQSTIFEATEIADQAAHIATGRIMAADLLRYTDDEDVVVQAVMGYAISREMIQNGAFGEDDGGAWCGDNCQRDLLFWRMGIDAAIRGRRIVQ